MSAWTIPYSKSGDSNAGFYEKYFISDTRNFPNHVYNLTVTLTQFKLICMCIGIEMSTISPLCTSKWQHGQYRTLKVKYYTYRHLLKSLYYIILDTRNSPNYVYNS